jgi:hypothetical protein
VTADGSWSLWDPNRLIPQECLTREEEQAVSHWFKLLEQGPAHVDGTHLPSSTTVASHFPLEHEDYEEPLPENVFQSRIPGTRFDCRFQVHPGRRAIHVIGFERGT